LYGVTSISQQSFKVSASRKYKTLNGLTRTVFCASLMAE
jgi:hypothetical protein